MSDLHILHVLPVLRAGGMELVTACIVSHLTGNGMRHSVLCIHGEPEIAGRFPPETDIHCLRVKRKQRLLPLRVARLVRKLRPDVIHALNWGAWPLAAVARRLAHRTIPLIVSMHGMMWTGHKPLRRRIASRVLTRATDVLLTVSEPTRRALIDGWCWPARTLVIPNGVDPDRFCPGPDRPAGGRFTIGAVGNLRAEKNHAMLIRACAELAEAGLDLSLRIAGKGYVQSQLAELIDSLGAGERIELLGHVEDVPALLRGLDLFVLPSDSEQHPNALLEAMACGLACVATRVGSADEVLDGGRCGRLVEPGDRAALAGAIGELASDPADRDSLGRAARARVVERYPLDRMVAAYRALYEQAARGASWRRGTIGTEQMPRTGEVRGI